MDGIGRPVAEHVNIIGLPTLTSSLSVVRLAMGGAIIRNIQLYKLTDNYNVHNICVCRNKCTCKMQYVM